MSDLFAYAKERSGALLGGEMVTICARAWIWEEVLHDLSQCETHPTRGSFAMMSEIRQALVDQMGA